MNQVLVIPSPGEYARRAAATDHAWNKMHAAGGRRARRRSRPNFSFLSDQQFPSSKLGP